MEIFITGLNRDFVEARADNRLMETAVGNEYTIYFTIVVGETIMRSSLITYHYEDLTFEKAKEIVVEKLSEGVVN